MEESPRWKLLVELGVRFLVLLQCVALVVMYMEYRNIQGDLELMERNRQLHERVEAAVVERCDVQYKMGQAYQTTLEDLFKRLGLDLGPQTPAMMVLEAYRKAEPPGGVGGSELETEGPTDGSPALP